MTDKPKSKARLEIERYEAKQKKELASIKAMPKGSKRFWKFVWYLIVWPWKWIWAECKDWRTFTLLLIVMAVVGSEVWVPALLGALAKPGAFKTSMLSVAATCEAFWLLPGTPFLALVVGLTMAIKALIDKIKDKKEKKQ